MEAATAPRTGLVRCPICRGTLASAGPDTETRCPNCETRLEVALLPAASKPPPTQSRVGEQAGEGEATCFFHPQKRAEIACDSCGRFLCSLCDLKVGAQHLCAACMSSGATGAKQMDVFVTRRTSWAKVALWLVLAPMVLPFFWFITAPVAFCLAVYGFRKPGSLIHGRRPVLLGIAATLALMQFAAFIIFIVAGVKS